MGWLKKLALAALALVVLLQFAPVARRTNPPVVAGRQLEHHTRLTPAVTSVLKRACRDCHSNETRWPWYSYVAPVSWAVVRDVERGRKVMNFSEWGVQAGRRPDIAASTLAAACLAARNGRMPRFPYAYLHSEARLSATDIQTLCSWTGAEFARLMMEHKKRQRTARQRTLAIASRSTLPVTPRY